MPVIVPYFPRCSILCLCLKCHSPFSPWLILSPFLLIFSFSPSPSSSVLFTCVRVCPYIFERTRYSFPADNTDRYTSHLLQRLMSVIYHNLIMGLGTCVHVCVCAPYFPSSVSLSPPCHCPFPPPHLSIYLNPSLSLPLFRSIFPPRPFYSPPPLFMRMWSDPPGSVCVCVRSRQRIRNIIIFLPEYHPYQCSHLRYLWAVTTQLTGMNVCVFYVCISTVV